MQGIRAFRNPVHAESTRIIRISRVHGIGAFHTDKRLVPQSRSVRTGHPACHRRPDPFNDDILGKGIPGIPGNRHGSVRRGLDTEIPGLRCRVAGSVLDEKTGIPHGYLRKGISPVHDPARIGLVQRRNKRNLLGAHGQELIPFFTIQGHFPGNGHLHAKVFGQIDLHPLGRHAPVIRGLHGFGLETRVFIALLVERKGVQAGGIAEKLDRTIRVGCPFLDLVGQRTCNFHARYRRRIPRIRALVGDNRHEHMRRVVFRRNVIGQGIHAGVHGQLRRVGFHAPVALPPEDQRIRPFGHAFDGIAGIGAVGLGIIPGNHRHRMDRRTILVQDNRPRIDRLRSPIVIERDIPGHHRGIGCCQATCQHCKKHEQSFHNRDIFGL